MPLIYYYIWTVRVAEKPFFLIGPWMLFPTPAAVVTTYMIVIIDGIISSYSFKSLSMLKLEVKELKEYILDKLNVIGINII